MTAEAYDAAERRLRNSSGFVRPNHPGYLETEIGRGSARRTRASPASKLATLAAVGCGRDPRPWRQSLVTMVRRITARVAATISDPNAVLSEGEVDKPSVANAGIGASLAQSDALVGGSRNAEAELELVTTEAAGYGYAAADINKLECSLRASIERADAACPVAEELARSHRTLRRSSHEVTSRLQEHTRYYTMGINSAWRCDGLETVLVRGGCRRQRTACAMPVGP